MKNKIIVLAFFLSITVSFLFGEGNRALYNNNLADEAYKEQNYYTAIEYYKAALQINPDYIDALHGLSLTYFKLEEYNEALKYLLEARRIDSFETSLMVLEGRIYTALGRYDDALKIFKSSLLKEPNNTEADLGMAELFVAEGDVLDAVKIYNKTLLYLPDDKRTLLSLIIILDKERHFQEADRYVSHLLRLYPNDSVVQYTAAKHFLSEGKADQIEAHAAAAVALNEKNQQAVLLLTRLYLGQKKYAQASHLLTQVLKINRNQPLIWYMLGEVYRLEKNDVQALQSYAIAVNLDADDELIRMALETFIIDHTAPYNVARDKYAAYHFAKGKAFETRNYLNKARREYRRGLIIAPHSDSGWLLYANLLKRFGFINRYLSILEQVAKDTPQDKNLQDKIEIYKSLIVDTVASKWKINQFEINKTGITLGIYSSNKNSLLHFNADYYLNRYLKNLLQGTERLSVTGMGEELAFAQAFNKARNNHCDYFVMLDSTEGEDTFSVTAKMYHGETGALLKEFSLYRTGNNRVSNALTKVSTSIQALIPLEGKILKREFNTALIDLGRADGIKKDDVFFIINPSFKPSINENFTFSVDSSHLLGEIKITRIDDLISEGTIKKYTFFDLINTGDTLIPDTKEGKTSQENTHTPAANTAPSDIYKTILTLP